MRHTLLPIVLLVAALGCASCGYALAGRGSFLPATIRVIGIPDFTNNTGFYQVEQVLTAKVRSEFIGRGRYKVLPQDTGVDGLLKGEITSISVTPTLFNEAHWAVGVTLVKSPKTATPMLPVLKPFE